MGIGDFEADDSEFYYFDGHIPKGMRTGREIRLVKLPELTWVYGYLMRAKGIGPVLYIRNAAMMEGVEGFHPIRSASEIRNTKTASEPAAQAMPIAREPTAETDFDVNFGDLPDIVPADLDNEPQTER
jgi:hypothetical protein